MTDRPRSFLRLVSSQDTTELVSADEGDDWALHDEDDEVAFPWATPPITTFSYEDASFMELAALWDDLTDGQIQAVLTVVRFIVKEQRRP